MNNDLHENKDTVSGRGPLRVFLRESRGRQNHRKARKTGVEAVAFVTAGQAIELEINPASWNSVELSDGDRDTLSRSLQDIQPISTEIFTRITPPEGGRLLFAAHRPWHAGLWLGENLLEALVQPISSLRRLKREVRFRARYSGLGFECRSNRSPTSEVGTEPTTGKDSSAWRRWTLTSGRCSAKAGKCFRRSPIPVMGAGCVLLRNAIRSRSLSRSLEFS